ncbi:hypothetical protein [Amycolatopsis taiwanensis]|uniref:hypothetical protein n=1 Tax=Amycolatopsis taiwanensis TaxID=342230 RepID=UPI000485621C|nr:hypothetical protein [Amycolatopsis taiwanensis]
MSSAESYRSFALSYCRKSHRYPATVVQFGMLVIRALEGPGYRTAGTNRFGKEPRSAEPVRS